MALTGHRMAPDDRVELRRMFPAELFTLFFGDPPAKGLKNVVLGVEVFDPALHIFRQVIVDSRRVSEERISADRRQDPGAQDTGKGGFFPEGYIRMPFVCRAQKGQDLIGQLQPVSRFDMQDFGMAGHVRCNRVAFQLAEIAAKADMLGMGDVLIAEDQNLVAEQSLFEIVNGRAVERAPEINARNFSPEDGTERREPRAGQRGGPRGGLRSGHSVSPLDAGNAGWCQV